MTSAEWLRDIGEACDELGYGIKSIEHGRIRLVPLRGKAPEIDIESVFLSGDELRRILRPVPETKP